MPPRYKFVEVSPVTDETLEAAVNEWVARGWQLEGIRFVVTEHSKRPQLAFVSFVTEREAMQAPQAGQAPDQPGPQCHRCRPVHFGQRQRRTEHADHGISADRDQHEPFPP